jgi:ribonucleoside-diphosphate reductase beta chain
MSILNKKNVDTTKQPIFLGEGLGLQRYDRYKYPIFFELFDKQLKFFWRPEEKDLSLDRVQFAGLEKHEKRIFTKNLLFQTMLDSVVARGVPSFTQYVTNPELEICMNTWGFFENIHSYSYTYIIKNVYADPSKVLDEALEDKEILARAETVTRYYDELNKKIDSEKDLKKKIYLSLISVNILEAIRFYVSFVCAFAFGENKKMMGNAGIIKLIRRDEAVHLFITQNILKILKNVPEEGFQDTIKECEAEAIKLFLDGVEEEKRWATYLFKDGSILGLNEMILHQYIEWLTDSRMGELGLPIQFGTKNPIKGWIDPWMDNSIVQVAPQETEITSYLISASVQDIDKTDFSGFDLD